MGEAPRVLSVVDLTGGLKGLVGYITAYWSAHSGCVINCQTAAALLAWIVRWG